MNLLTSLKKAVLVVKKLNSNGISASLSYLPVIARSEIEIVKNVRMYESMLNIIKQEKLDSDVTLKLHQFGVYKSLKRAKTAIAKIVDKAVMLNNFVWIDQERKITVEAAIEIFEEVNNQGNTGLCLQAYLDRTEADLKYILKQHVPIRLVKGFYKPYDFDSWDKVTQNYDKLLEPLIKDCLRPAIATHDLRLIKKAKALIAKYGKKETAELQFFKGVRDDLAKRLVEEGFKVRIYVPFGNVLKFLYKGMSTFDNYHHMQRFFGFKKLI